MEDWKAKQAARAAAAAAMQAAFPYLVPVGGKVDSLVAAAKNMRIELARAFPGVKFSVKSRRFSGGDSIDVSWTDGPTGDQVDAIIDRYSAGSFDGMQDLYTYERSAWTDAFGDAKYVNSRRDASDKAVASAIRTVCAKYGVNLKQRGIEPTVAAYRAGAYYSTDIMENGSDYWSLQSIISREIARRTWALNKTAPASVPADMETAA
jgi:hypothetical protein